MKMMSGIQPVVTTVIVFVALTLTTVLGHEYSAHHQVSFSWLHIVIPFLWVVFFGWLFSPYFRSNGRVSMLPVVTLLTLTLIVVGITLPGKTKRSVLREIVQTTVNLTKNFNHTDHHVTSTRRREIYNDYNKLSFIDKIGHFVLFGCFTLLLVLVAAPVSKGILLLNLAMLAAGTEMLQLFIPLRTPLVRDWFIDMGGVMLAMGIMMLWGEWRFIRMGRKCRR